MEAIVGENGWILLEKAGRKGSFADDGDGVDVIMCTAISFGKDESMDLERLEERMNKDCVQSWLDEMLGNRYLVYIFLIFLLLSLAYLVTRKKTDDSVA